MGIRLCHLEDIPDPGSLGFDPGGEGASTLFVVRRGAKVFTYRNVCPHHGARLAWRKDAYLNRDGDRIVCHAHGAQFCPETGLCLLGPCLGEFLAPVAITVTPGGDIYLADTQD